MEGYLGGPQPSGAWRTGDLGSLDEAGYLTVFGRKDNLIVTSLGRNVSPEWIETMLLADPRVGLCMVLGHGEPQMSALIVPSAAGAEWFAKAGRDGALELVSQACAGSAFLRRATRCDTVDCRCKMSSSLGLMTSNGRFRCEEAPALLRTAAAQAV